MKAGDGFELVPAQAADADRLAALHRAVIGEADGWSDAGLARTLSASAARGVTALDSRDGAVIGFVIGLAAAGEAEILALCVAQSHRRRGVARTMLRRFARELAAEGTTQLHLEVRASNFPARELYARTGFVETGRRRNYYQGTEDAVTMSLALREG